MKKARSVALPAAHVRVALHDERRQHPHAAEAARHADLKTTMIYAHLSPDFMAAEVAKMTFPAPVPAEVTDIEQARRRRDGYPKGNGADRAGQAPGNENGDREVPVGESFVSPEGIEPSTNGLGVRHRRAGAHVSRGRKRTRADGGTR